MRNILHRLLAAWPFLVALQAPALGETTVLRPTARLVESVTDRPPTVGLLIAGLHLGHGSGEFRPGEIRIGVPPSLLGQAVCLRLASRDGVYRALVPYRVAEDASRMPLLDFPTDRARLLSAMPVGSVAARLVAAAQCNEGSSGPLVPVSLRGGSDRAMPSPTELVVLVNASDARVSATLVDREGRPLLERPVNCEEERAGVTVVFTMRCRLRLPASVGQVARLQLTIIDLVDGRSQHGFDVLLPSSTR